MGGGSSKRHAQEIRNGLAKTQKVYVSGNLTSCRKLTEQISYPLRHSRLLEPNARLIYIGIVVDRVECPVHAN